MLSATAVEIKTKSSKKESTKIIRDLYFKLLTSIINMNGNTDE